MENKIINIDTLIINRNREKICKCSKPSFIIDTQNHIVQCKECMAILDPFEALLKIATMFDEINNEVKNAINYRNELMKYKPHLKEAKRLEQMMREEDLLPICPKCGKAFEWNKLTSMINKNYI